MRASRLLVLVRVFSNKAFTVRQGKIWAIQLRVLVSVFSKEVFHGPFWLVYVAACGLVSLLVLASFGMWALLVAFDGASGMERETAVHLFVMLAGRSCALVDGLTRVVLLAGRIVTTQGQVVLLTRR